MLGTVGIANYMHQSKGKSSRPTSAWLYYSHVAILPMYLCKLNWMHSYPIMNNKTMKASTFICEAC